MGLSRPSLGGARDKVAAYAALVRVPNLFTAPPDVLLGATLATGSVLAAPRAVAGLALASVLLYAAGTTLNDAFDAPVDASERPVRPIPSGEVARETAFALGAVLLLAGVAAAWLAAGQASAVLAALLAAGIVLYDAFVKGSATGFLVMGAVRGLNVLLGATVAGTLVGHASAASIVVVPVVVGYIAAVTYMAERETEGGNRGAVGVAALGAGGAALSVTVLAVATSPGPVEAVVSLGLGAAFVWWTGRPLRRAYAEPIPERVGPAVGACVVALVLLDGAFAAAADAPSGLLVAAFVVPAVGLSRTFDVT